MRVDGLKEALASLAELCRKKRGHVRPGVLVEQPIFG